MDLSGTSVHEYSESARVRSELLEHRKAVNINIHFTIPWKFSNNRDRALFQI